MSYLVVCTFDLKNATDKDYQNAYADLSKIGLSKTAKGNNGSHVTLPTTTTCGEFNGQSASEVSTDIVSKVKNVFANHSFTSEIFVSVGGDWAWSHRTT